MPLDPTPAAVRPRPARSVSTPGVTVALCRPSAGSQGTCGPAGSHQQPNCEWHESGIVASALSRQPSQDCRRGRTRPSSSRQPSQGGGRLGLPSGEVMLPLRPKLFRQLGRSRVLQCDEDPLERSTRFAENSIRCNHDQPPAHSIQVFSAINVASPLLWVLGVLTAVVFEQRLPLQIRHVVTAPPLTILSAHNDVDLGLRQASEDDKEAETSLLYRIDPGAGEARCSKS